MAGWAAAEARAAMGVAPAAATAAGQEAAQAAVAMAEGAEAEARTDPTADELAGDSEAA